MRIRAEHPNIPAGFTLWELLIVMAIIGMLTALSMPAIRGLKKSNVMADANQQLLNDLAYARLKAIKDRTTVHVVFVPPSIMTMSLPASKLTDRLMGEQYRAYALYSERTAGDQPGRPFHRFLTDWKSLPDGVVIAGDNFRELNPVTLTNQPAQLRPFEYMDLPFPTSADAPQSLPHVAFDPQGSLTYQAGGLRFRPQYIWLTMGSILAVRDQNDQLISYDFMERPPGNWRNNTNRIHIDATTGRARLERRDIQ